MLAIDGATARRLLPMDRCIDLMDEALAGLARGNAANPLRSMLLMPFETPYPRSWPACRPRSGDPPALGIKIISVFPGNHGTGYESHQGFVLLFEPEHGSPVALIDAIAITAIRTAAVSGLATRLLARPDATDLAIIGSGTQARSHLDAMRAVRPWASTRLEPPPRAPRRLRGRCGGRRRRGGGQCRCPRCRRGRRHRLHRDRFVHAGGRRLLAGRGAHINAVGSSQATNRELDNEAVRRSRLFVDRLESARNEAGDYLIPLREGAIGEDHIVAEIGEVAAGMAEGRRSADEITLFKSLGLAIEDLAAARWIHQRALETGAGTTVPLG